MFTSDGEVHCSAQCCYLFPLSVTSLPSPWIPILTHWHVSPRPILVNCTQRGDNREIFFNNAYDLIIAIKDTAWRSPDSPPALCLLASSVPGVALPRPRPRPPLLLHLHAQEQLKIKKNIFKWYLHIFNVSLLDVCVCLFWCKCLSR